MRIMLVGHEGYLGTGLKTALQARGHELIGWSRIQDIGKITNSVLSEHRIDSVINAATAMDRVHSRFTIDSPSDYVNVSGVRSLVTALADTSIKFIQLSSKDVYGDVFTEKDIEETNSRYIPHHLVDDLQALNPKTIYAKTKLMGEFLAEAHPVSNIVRITSCYTDHEHPHENWMVKFCRSVAKRQVISLMGSGKQVRDLLHVDDLAELLHRMLKGQQWGLKVNAGGGIHNAVSLLETIHLINPHYTHIEHKEGGDYGFVASNRLALETYNWKPQILFQDRIEALKELIFTGANR
ncbi:MAG: NAD-dependent epimerase/dehydratase family protein [Oligoflexales bacterium]|nr:NAD-dependent epimerase/dehydratase family protein [Oligoflexales bacterium]